MFLTTRIRQETVSEWIGWIVENPDIKISGSHRVAVSRKIRALALRELADRIEAGNLDQEKNFTVYQSIAASEDEI
ncbi:MAG: hypothetical protein KME07_07235 [Pegethrix bostrychoides GSE-TBD4-15B]|uniref:Uncharacterized protein n=1 Tax=Pegethrix bostrychoides GSE-TBD4-15B TaxID=2839662 RepID=A0A951PAP3_9CYAN|nr:hypothetical protein [Pegethrix bostrychoides GSE-TBD4-15B]